MSRKVYFGKNDLRFFYYRYKDSNYYSLSIIILSIVVCLILIFTVIIPQGENYLSKNREVAIEQKKIDTLKDNINFVNNLDKALLDSQFQTVLQALPTENDFVSVLSALSDASIKSSVTLSDFSFDVDKVSSTKSNLYIDLAIKITGNIDQVNGFLKEINEKLPIAEVEDLNSNLNSTFLSLKFYYKAHSDLEFNSSNHIKAITDADKELINELSSWKISSVNLPVDSNSTTSASASSSLPLFE